MSLLSELGTKVGAEFKSHRLRIEALEADNGSSFDNGGTMNGDLNINGHLLTYQDTLPTLSQYSYVDSHDFQARNGNYSHLEVRQFIDSPSPLQNWNHAGTRLQQRIDATFMGYIQFNGYGNDYGLSIGTGGGTAGPQAAIERIRIDRYGKVGIGTTSPDYTLDVNGSARVENETSWATFRCNGVGTDSELIVQDYGNTTSGSQIRTSGNAPLRIGTNSTDVLVISGAGVVTIDGSNVVTEATLPALSNETASIGFRAYAPSAGINATITFGSEGFDRGNCFSPSTGTFTAPKSGMYLFSFAILQKADGDHHRITFKINGVSSTQYGDPLTSIQPSYYGVTMTQAFVMSAGDTLSLYNQGSSVYGAQYGSFSGVYLGT